VEKKSAKKLGIATEEDLGAEIDSKP